MYKVSYKAKEEERSRGAQLKCHIIEAISFCKSRNEQQAGSQVQDVKGKRFFSFVIDVKLVKHLADLSNSTKYGSS
ncbi:hypothetical protein [Patiriisocius sp. Uisw_047]|jgi:hypothetical protein|uniref:hypothetical protein n=1 Tax=Patiriisocius sp. Uisw_047 TaxID=3230969 RepID=UPI0039ECE9AE